MRKDVSLRRCGIGKKSDAPPRRRKDMFIEGQSNLMRMLQKIPYCNNQDSRFAAQVTALTSAKSLGTNHFDDDARYRNSSRI